VVFLLVWGSVFFATIPSEFWPVLVGYLLGVLGYIANWLIIYWRPLGVFGHTWSLAIEEQFYLVWPVILLLLLRWVRSPRWIVAGLVTAAAGSLAWRLALAWVADASLPRIYAGTDTHADGLLIGAALAVWLRHRGGTAPGPWRRAGVACSLGLLGLLLAAPLFPGYVWGVTVLAALATNGLICDILARSSRGTRWLEVTWLVRLGRISYGVYLWHWPVYFQLGVLWRPGESAAPFGPSALAWGLTVAAAGLSYFLIERPFLAYKARLSADPEIEPAPAARVPPAAENGGRALPASL
jgi:peptidoglycan/LPS O-acetylase OafA/YrhL